MSKKKEFAQGYLEALEMLDKHITDEQKRKGEFVTPDKLLDVYNSIIAKLHTEQSLTKTYLRGATYETQPVDEVGEMTALLSELFGNNVKLVDIKDFIIQGGTKL